jgi:hypothetical protein
MKPDALVVADLTPAQAAKLVTLDRSSAAEPPCAPARAEAAVSRLRARGF